MTDSTQQQQQSKQKGGGNTDQRLNEILNLLRQLIKQGAQKGSQAIQDKAEERANDPEKIDDHVSWFAAYALIAITGCFFFNNAVPYQSAVRLIMEGPQFIVWPVGAALTFFVQYFQLKPLMMKPGAPISQIRFWRRLMYFAYGLDLVVCLNYWPVIEGLEDGWGLVSFNPGNAFKCFIIVASLGCAFWFRNFLRRAR